MQYLDNDDNAEDLIFFEDKSIEDEYYKQNENVYNYALDLTIKETEQAAEGMFHNLNY